MVKIVKSRARDIRFPTSQHADGSDAMNLDPDYSAAYVVLETDQPGLEGHGLTFTLGKGNELCVAAIEALLPIVLGRDLTEITADMACLYCEETNAVQLRWVWAEKDLIHLATGPVGKFVCAFCVNVACKPVW